MDYVTTCDQAAAHLADLDPSDPFVPAALAFAVQPWFDRIHHGADMMRWGLFVGAVQSISEGLWPQPAALAIVAPAAAVPGDQLDLAVIRLVTAVADLLAQASRRDTSLRAWDFAAASTELRDATKELG